MPLEKQTKGMLDPNQKESGAYGFKYEPSEAYTTATSAVRRFSGIENALSKVSVQTPEEGQESFPSRDNLGKPYAGKAGD